ncbi:MAG: sugar phosphate nucleotidyltransferase [Nitrospirota bacterium]
MQKSVDIVGLLPAGGRSTRIEPLPCSKEIFPIGFVKVTGTDSVRPKPVSQYLLEKMRKAGVKKAYFILREGKWDIPKYFGDGASVDMNLGYLMMRLPFGTPYTLDQAYPFIRDSIVAFGFPDILFDADDAFVQLLERQASTGADVVLGLCPVAQSWTMDMVEVDDKGGVRSIVIKPAVASLGYGWIIAVWSPVFTQFLHEHLPSQQREGISEGGMEGQSELSVGHVLQAALQNGLRMEGVQFPECFYLDIGTPDNLCTAVYDRKFHETDACYVKQIGA